MQCHLHLHIVQATNNSKIEIEQECNAEQSTTFIMISFQVKKLSNHSIKPVTKHGLGYKGIFLWLMTSLYTCDTFFYF